MTSFHRTPVRLILAAVIGSVLVASVIVAQNRYRNAAQRGPYRVFMTKPIVGLGIKVGDLYREHELLGAALNDLDHRGFVPLWTEVLAAETKDLPREERLLIFCRKR